MLPILITFGIDLEGTGLDMRPMDELPMRLQAAALEAANYAKAAWARTADLLGAHDKGEYINGIQAAAVIIEHEQTATDSDGQDYYEVVVAIKNTAPHANIVEDGHVAFHLPSRIDWSRTDGRIKRTSKGKPYLHIPFRHFAPVKADAGPTHQAIRHQMPQDIYEQAKKLRRRERLNQGPIYDEKGQFVAADRYKWTGKRGKHRLERGEVATGFRVDPNGIAVEERRSERLIGRTPGPRSKGGGRPMVNPEWQTSKWEGLMKTGPIGHTQYMTIRTLTPDSRGWHVPARQGQGIARAVASELGHDPELRAIVLEAMQGMLP